MTNTVIVSLDLMFDFRNNCTLLYANVSPGGLPKVYRSLPMLIGLPRPLVMFHHLFEESPCNHSIKVLYG